MRLAFPRRVYTQSHVNYVAEVLLHVDTMAHRIRGVKMLDAPEVLRHFTATFGPVQEGLVVSWRQPERPSSVATASSRC